MKAKRSWTVSVTLDADEADALIRSLRLFASSCECSGPCEHCQRIRLLADTLWSETPQ